jgi:hypothetical protein
MRDYPSNHVRFIDYRLETGPDFLYIYMKGYDRLRTPEHIPIEHIYFTRYMPVRCNGTQIDEPPTAQYLGDERGEYNGDGKIRD